MTHNDITKILEQSRTALGDHGNVTLCRLLTDVMRALAERGDAVSGTAKAIRESADQGFDEESVSVNCGEMQGWANSLEAAERRVAATELSRDSWRKLAEDGQGPAIKALEAENARLRGTLEQIASVTIQASIKKMCGYALEVKP